MGSKSRNKASCIAIFGTGSEVGKSIVATALCRSLSNKGIRVAPYKAQNMSNNSGITPEGLEMGRAQIVQAEAARLAPHVDMNPILLKPTGESGSQVVLLGKAIGNVHSKQYVDRRETLFNTAQAALKRLRNRYDAIIIEGAGSCAEVNLMKRDIVNFRVAESANAPVILVADIHRGGVFAQIVGTLACIPQKNRDRIIGIVINRFRGDKELFADGIRWIEKKVKKPVLGVLPWLHDIRIEAEDSVVLESAPRVPKKSSKRPAVAVIHIPHISNFTDFDPLFAIEGMDVFFIHQADDLGRFRAVILPGSKNTRNDLEWLYATGWEQPLKAYAKSGGHFLGICGGYQMLGRSIRDDKGLEGTPGITRGLSLLPVDTRLKAPKITTRTRFSWTDSVAEGYEIHMGQTRRNGATPWFRVLSRNSRDCHDEDGCMSSDGRILGTYIHGLFDSSGVTRLWLQSLGLSRLTVSEDFGITARERQYDLLAAHFEKHVDWHCLQSALITSTRTV